MPPSGICSFLGGKQPSFFARCACRRRATSACSHQRCSAHTARWPLQGTADLPLAQPLQEASGLTAAVLIFCPSPWAASPSRRGRLCRCVPSKRVLCALVRTAPLAASAAVLTVCACPLGSPRRTAPHARNALIRADLGGRWRASAPPPRLALSWCLGRGFSRSAQGHPRKQRDGDAHHGCEEQPIWACIPEQGSLSRARRPYKGFVCFGETDSLAHPAAAAPLSSTLLRTKAQMISFSERLPPFRAAERRVDTFCERIRERSAKAVGRVQIRCDVVEGVPWGVLARGASR